MARRLGLVSNPAAGGDTTAAVEEARAIAASAGWELAEARSEMRGHAFILAQELAAGGADLVAAAGGDGTVREVAAGLAGGQTPLAIVAAGTGNSSYLELYGDTPWQATLAAVLQRSTVRPVDLMEIQPTGEYSLLGFSAGWFAQIVQLAASSSASGIDRYVEGVAAASAAPLRFSARVTVDGRLLAEGELGLLAVGGARMRASVFPVFPGSEMDDGLLEVLAIQATDGAGFDDLVKAVMERRHLEHPLAAYTRGQRVEVVAPEGLLAEVDGDLWERELYEVSVTCRPGVLPLAVAAASSS